MKRKVMFLPTNSFKVVIKTHKSGDFNMASSLIGKNMILLEHEEESYIYSNGVFVCIGTVPHGATLLYNNQAKELAVKLVEEGVTLIKGSTRSDATRI